MLWSWWTFLWKCFSWSCNWTSQSSFVPSTGNIHSFTYLDSKCSCLLEPPSDSGNDGRRSKCTIASRTRFLCHLQLPRSHFSLAYDEVSLPIMTVYETFRSTSSSWSWPVTTWNAKVLRTRHCHDLAAIVGSSHTNNKNGRTSIHHALWWILGSKSRMGNVQV